MIATAVACDYPVAEAIVREARRYGADLIVAERHATRHVAPWLLGYNDWELLRESAAPVLLVKSPRRYAHPVVLAAVDPAHSFAKPAKLDDEILHTGQLIGNALRGTLHAVHAFASLPAWHVAGGVHRSGAGHAHRRAGQRAGARQFRSRAGSAQDPARAPAPVVEPSRATRSWTSRAEIGSDLVVMGAISRSGLKSLFVGNTAEQVLDQLGCDVLVVKPPHFVSRVSRRRRGLRFLPELPLAP